MANAMSQVLGQGTGLTPHPANAAQSHPLFLGGEQPPEPGGRYRKSGIYSQPGELGAFPGSLARLQSLVPGPQGIRVPAIS